MLEIEKANENEVLGYTAREDISNAKSAFMRLQNSGYEGADQLARFSMGRAKNMPLET